MKKKIQLLFIAILLSANAFAQVNNFFVKDSRLIWENAFLSDNTSLPMLLQRHPRLTIVSTEGNIYKGQGSEIRTSCPGTSSFMEHEVSFDFEIEMSDGKYRATVYNLKFTSVDEKKGKAVIKPESVVVAKGAIKKKYNEDLNCLNSYFTRIFTMTPIYKNKS